MRNFFKHTALIFLSGLILLVFAGCSKKDPEAILKQMMQEMAQVDSYYTELKLWVNGQFPQLTSLNFDKAQFQSGTILVDLAGDMSFGKTTAYALKGTGKYRLTGSELEFAGDLIYRDGILYLKLSSVPNLQLVNLALLKDQWYKFDFTALGLFPKLTAKESKDSASQNKKIKKLAAKTNFFQLVADEGIDVASNRESHRYRVKVNASALADFINAVTEIIEGREVTLAEQQNLLNNLAAVADLEARLWIDRKTYRLNRLEFGLPITTPERGLTRYDLAVNFYEFNKKVAINAPSSVRDFNMAELLLGSVGAGGMTTDSTLNIEEQLKQIQNITPEELQKGLLELSPAIK